VTCVELRNGTTSKCVVAGVNTAYPYPETTLIESLRELKDVYVDAVNRAVADDRDDLVTELVAEYSDEALKLMSRVLSVAA
jgi:hypothetical protein